MLAFMFTLENNAEDIATISVLLLSSFRYATWNWAMVITAVTTKIIQGLWYVLHHAFSYQYHASSQQSMYSYDLVTNNSRIWSRVLCLCMAWNWTQEYYIMRCSFNHASLARSTEDCSYAKSIPSVYPQITCREISWGRLQYLKAPKCNWQLLFWSLS